MNDEQVEFLLNLATKFRKAIEKCDKTILPISFKEFPLGACGDAALLLAKYLQESDCDSSEYICGKRRGKYHAWLQQGDITIDITADQFTDNDQRVIVTRNSEWHENFKIEQRNEADYEKYDKHTASELGRTYKIITAYLKNS